MTLTRLPLARYSAALSACLPHKVHRIEVASSSRPSPLPRRALEMAMTVPLLIGPSRPLTVSTRTGAASRAFLCSTLTNAMTMLLASG
jgi:hypothetical protein